MVEYDGEEADADFVDQDGKLFQYNVDKVMEQVRCKWAFAKRFRTRIKDSEWYNAITTAQQKFEDDLGMGEDEADHAAWQQRKYLFEREIMPYLYQLDATEKYDEDDEDEELSAKQE